MDVRGWKNILLQFITECGFTQRIYFNIEQSDVDEFFQNFCERHHKTKGKQPRIKLVEFLKENYSKFEPNLDDGNAVVAADFIYVYSLLLHFCCVQYPDPYFHEKCQNLSEQSQNVIAGFFKCMLQCEEVDRNFLRQSIEEIMQANPRTNESSTSSSNSNMTGLTSMDSPTKTPQRSASTQRISPNTPKTFLLEERTRELYHLRAQLETERYEKGVLEVQIKQMEEKISRLNMDHKNLHLHIQDLKNDILRRSSEGSENGSPERNPDEESKRRLCKEISRKEAEISKLADLLSTFKEEKLIVEEKLVFAEKKIVICVDRMNELDNKVYELGKELEEKDKEIKFLAETNRELEQYVAETRRSCAANRPDLNSTAECMEHSFSRGTNSSGSLCSPENLGSYDVDIQLREKERENNRLREELTKLLNTYGSLARHINQVAIKHSDDFDVDIEIDQDNDLDNEELANDATRRFLLFTQSLEVASKNYSNQQSAIKQLSEENYLIHEENDSLKRKVAEMDSLLNLLKANLDKSEKLNMEIESEKSDLKGKLHSCQLEIQALTSQKLELDNKIAQMQKEFDQRKICEEKQNKRLKEELTAVSMKMQELQETHWRKTQEFEAEITSFNEKLAGQTKELEASRLAEHTVKDKYEELLIQCETMKSEKRNTDNHLQHMHTEMSKTAVEMTKLGLELTELGSKKAELEERIERLTQESLENNEMSMTAIKSKDERIKEIESELSTATTLLERSKDALRAAETKSDNFNAKMEELLAKLEDISMFLQVPLLKDDLEGGIQNIVLKIKELVENQMEATHKIECLELACMDSSNHITSMEEKMQECRVERQEHTKRYKELKTQLKRTIDDYEGQLATLKSEKRDLEEMLNGVPERCSDCTSGLYKKRILEKERELNNMLDEYNGMKSILLSTEEKFDHLMNDKYHLEHRLSQRLKLLTEKLQELCDENLQLKGDIGTFKSNHTRIEKELKEGEANLMRALDQLQEESSVKIKINEDLAATKQALGIAEEEISNLTANLRIAEEKLSCLDSLKARISDDEKCIADLAAKLSKENEENERLNTEIHKLTLDVESKVSEQIHLLKVLEDTSAQLKRDTDEYKRNTKDLIQRCDELRQELEAAKEKNMALEQLKAAKECELEVVKEEIHKERADWHMKLSELTQKVDEKTAELEHMEISVLDICSAFEKYANAPDQVEPQNAPNWFSSVDTLDCGKLNELRKAFLGIFNRFEGLNKEILQLQADRNEALANYERIKHSEESIQSAHCSLQKKFAELQEISKTEMKVLEARLISRLKLVEEDRQHLEGVNEKLTQENNNLFRKIENLEETVSNWIHQEEECQKALRRETQLHETAVNSLTVDLERMREQLRLHTSMLNKSEQRAQKAQARAEIAEDALKGTNEKYEAQKEYIESATKDHAKICAELQVLQKEHEALKNLCSQLQTEIKREECESKLDQLITENEAHKEELLKAEKYMQKIQIELEQRAIEHNKIIVENTALRESLQTVTKSFEEQAKELENNKIAIDVLQGEKDELSLEAEALRDQISKAENTLVQNNEKIRALEEERKNLTAAQQELKASANEAYKKITKLEKAREANEQKLWSLTESLEATEKENVRQCLEIGALNTELKAAQDNLNLERQRLKEHRQTHETTIHLELQKLEERAKQYEAVQAQLREYEQNAKVSEKQIRELKEKVVLAQAQLDTLTQDAVKNGMERQTLEKQKLQLFDELEVKTKALEVLEKRKQQLSEELAESKTKLNQAWNDNKELVEKHAKYEESKQMELQAMQERLRDSTAELADALNQLILMRAESAASNAEIAELRARLCVLETGLDKEQKLTAKLSVDNQVLQAKYAEAKSRLEAELQASEERIKENRLELEGKLEKMKNKMKTLYTEETAKMRTKQEREVVMLKSQKDVLEAQNKKYEEHNRKLSNQIVRLNDKVLEHQKENAFLQTKLKHLEDSRSGVFKRPSSIQGSTITSTASASSNLGSNLTMEDEEGELFNNTYLTDLKNGVCAEELQYRNSLVLPHLKCTYAAYDHGMAEDELKDGPHSLDDSTSALLSTTSGGAARKKISGVTHYQRPGPPTPSKRVGRLSLGGSNEPAREVLRESDDSNVPTSSTAKTPTRFGFFSSRFSLGSGKDEPPDVPPCENLHVKNSEAGKSVGFIAACTSTPRKSHERYEQRRLLDDMSTGTPASPCPSGISVDNWVGDVKVTPRTIAPAESHSTRHPQERGRCRYRFQRRPEASSGSGGGPAEGNPNSSAAHTRDRALPRKSIKCHPNIRRITRPSLNLRGNIFMKHRTPIRKQTRQQKDTKARRQRLDRFNNNRHLDSPQQEQTLENNNYTEFNHNPSLFGVTRVIVKKECPCESYEEQEYESSISMFMSEIDDLDLMSSSLDDVYIENMDSYDTKFDDESQKSQSKEPPNDAAATERFEQLMAMTESEAPFEVAQRDLDNLKPPPSTTSGEVKEEGAVLRKSDAVPSTPDLALSPASMSSLQHSRTIYGNSMVFHRRIPHIDCTHVLRKSSIYVRTTGDVNSDQLADGVLVLADETITLIDFMHMWSRMDLSARIFLASSFFAIVSAIISLYAWLF